MDLSEEGNLEVTYNVNIYSRSDFSLPKINLVNLSIQSNSKSETHKQELLSAPRQISLRRDGLRPLKEFACLLIKLEKVPCQQVLGKEETISISLYLTSGTDLIVAVSLEAAHPSEKRGIYRSEYIESNEDIQDLLVNTIHNTCKTDNLKSEARVPQINKNIFGMIFASYLKY